MCKNQNCSHRNRTLPENMHAQPPLPTIPKKPPVLIITDAKWLALKEENGWSASC